MALADPELPTEHGATDERDLVTAPGLDLTEYQPPLRVRLRSEPASAITLVGAAAAAALCVLQVVLLVLSTDQAAGVVMLRTLGAMAFATASAGLVWGRSIIVADRDEARRTAEIEPRLARSLAHLDDEEAAARSRIDDLTVTLARVAASRETADVAYSGGIEYLGHIEQADD